MDKPKRTNTSVPTMSGKVQSVVDTVTLSNGTMLEIHPLTTGDYFDALMVDKVPSDLIGAALAAKACGISLKDLRDLPIQDGLKIINAAAGKLEDLLNTGLPK